MARRDGRAYGRIYGDRLREAAPDRWILVLAFLLGALGGAFLKLQGHTLLPWPESIVWISAVWATACLFLYAGFASAFGRARIEPEVIGDNCYYLGFLFTLTSLAVTLYQLGGLESANVLRDIIAGFGVALSSTIVGVALRVWFFQFRSGLIARDRETRIALHKAAREFRASLTTSLQDMKRFSTESTQLASERNQRIESSTEAALKSHQDQLARNAEEYGRIVTETFKAAFEASAREMSSAVAKVTEDALSEVRVPIADLGKRLDGFREQEMNCLENLAKQVATVEAEFEAIVATLGEVSLKIEKFSEGLGNASDMLDSELTDTTARIRDASGDIVRQFSNAAAMAKLDVAGSDLRKVADSLLETHNRLKQMESVSDSITSGLRKGADSLQDSTDLMIRQFNELFASDAFDQAMADDQDVARSASDTAKQFDQLARQVDGLVRRVLLELAQARNEAGIASGLIRDNSRIMIESAEQLNDSAGKKSDSSASAPTSSRDSFER
ncbi:MAG: hypothetical protein OXC26_24625 [Albidovulum sp.]|nr:hypothetical protein [Albidovulum sp.]